MGETSEEVENNWVLSERPEAASVLPAGVGPAMDSELKPAITPEAREGANGSELRRRVELGKGTRDWGRVWARGQERRRTCTL